MNVSKEQLSPESAYDNLEMQKRTHRTIPSQMKTLKTEKNIRASVFSDSHSQVYRILVNKQIHSMLTYLRYSFYYLVANNPDILPYLQKKKWNRYGYFQCGFRFLMIFGTGKALEWNRIKNYSQLFGILVSFLLGDAYLTYLSSTVTNQAFNVLFCGYSLLQIHEKLSAIKKDISLKNTIFKI